jgi:hypothetical protein
VTHSLLSLDPGLDFAACLWVDRVLVWAALRSLPAVPLDELVIEDQDITKRTMNPKSQLKLAQTAGRLAERVHATKETWVGASRWMGGSPPHFILEGRILGALSKDERKILDRALKGVSESYRHNVTDAAGIGLWALQRLPK